MLLFIKSVFAINVTIAEVPMDKLGYSFFKTVYPHNPMSIPEYLSLANQVTNFVSGSPNLNGAIDLLKSNNLLGLAIVLIVGFLLFALALLVFVLYPCILCIKSCIQPLRRTRKLTILCLCFLLILFVGGYCLLASSGFIFSTLFSNSALETKKIGLDAFDAVLDFIIIANKSLGKVNVTLANAGPIINSTFSATKAEQEISNIFPDYLVVVSNLRAINSNLSTLKTIMENNTIMMNGYNLKKPLLSSLMSSFDSVLTIDGVNYSIPNVDRNAFSGSLPSSINQTGFFSNLTSQVQMLNQVDLGSAIVNVSQSATTYLNNIYHNINESHISIVPPIVNNATQSIATYKQEFSSLYDKYIITNDHIRSDGTKIFWGCVVLGCCFCLISVLTQVGKIMHFVIILFLIFNILFWGQFLVYFLLGLPVNEFCFSIDKVLKYDLVSNNVTFNPNFILETCQNGGNLLTMRLSNSSNSTIPRVLGMAEIFEALDNPDTASFSSILESAIPNSTTDLVSSLNSSISLLNSTNLSLSFDQINETAINSQFVIFNALTPSSINSNYSDAYLVSNLTQFNTLCTAQRSTWTSYTTASFSEAFVVNGQSFNPITQFPGISSGDSIAIQTSWLTTFSLAQYNYSATTKIQQIKTNVTLMQSLVSESNSNWTKVHQNSVIAESARINMTQSAVLVRNSLQSMNQNFTAFKAAFHNILLLQLEDGLNLFASYLLNNISQGTECNVLSKPVISLLTTLCLSIKYIMINFRNSFNGNWVTNGIAGLAVFPFLIIVTLALSRFGKIPLISRKQNNEAESRTMAKGLSKKKSPQSPTIPENV